MPKSRPCELKSETFKGNDYFSYDEKNDTKL